MISKKSVTEKTEGKKISKKIATYQMHTTTGQLHEKGEKMNKYDIEMRKIF